MKQKVAETFKNGLGKVRSASGNALSRLFKREGIWKYITAFLLLLFLVFWGFGWYLSREPNTIDVIQKANRFASEKGESAVLGYTTTHALILTAETLLDKPGGYMSNDVVPPFVMLDNMPNWEFGVLVQVRDLTRALRNDISRSRSQSLENPALAKAEPLFNIDNESWMFPSAESKYREGIEALSDYRKALVLQNREDTQFYARADNLADWLSLVEKRLGSLSQRLSAGVGQARINTDLAGDSAASQSTGTGTLIEVKTPWLEIDDVFYEARGSTWALINFFKAVRHDFADILAKKNAGALVDQIIRELEESQRSVRSPIILNGSGFGIFANHSLVMANYISRANAALIDLRTILSDG